MLLLREPSDERIRRFLDGQRSLPLSYPEVGASQGRAPTGYGVNHNRGRLGTGPQDFARAVEALKHWKMYETGWTRLCWPDAPISEGAVVGVVGRHLGFRSLNACRIVYVYGEEEPSLQRYGFAVGTLPGHVERGEERFTVEWHEADDAVYYEVFAFSRPARVLRGVLLLPTGPSAGEGHATARAPHPEKVRGRLAAEHAGGRRACYCRSFLRLSSR